MMVVRPWASPHEEDIHDEEILSQTHISEEAARVAMRELREDESTRKHGLQQMREWLRKNKDVENVRSGIKYYSDSIKNWKIFRDGEFVRWCSLSGLNHTPYHNIRTNITII